MALSVVLGNPATDRHTIAQRLREADGERTAGLFAEADDVRRREVGECVHFRGLIEISNHCRRSCWYCGLRVEHRILHRYRLSADEILACARAAAAWGCGTAVLQSGEDSGLTSRFVGGVVERIKAETPLAVTLSLGERCRRDFLRWKRAGADRYLLRFETSNNELMRRIHPVRRGTAPRRIELLRILRDMGYEIGSGVMVGLPGQTYEDLANDIAIFAELDLDMIGCGPFLPHPATPLGRGRVPLAISLTDQVPADASMALKVIALSRLACPQANIAVSTALSTLDPMAGRERGLQCGANVLMPNFSPSMHRAKYAIYPAKSDVGNNERESPDALRQRTLRLGRSVGSGRGDSPAYRARRAERTATMRESLP